MEPAVAGITISNPDKVMFPAARFTKADVVAYYVGVAPYLLPHLQGRPVTLKRYPDGVGNKSFYEKDAPSFTPAWVKRFPVPRRHGGPDIQYILIEDQRTLGWCANIASLELHPFLHRVPAIDVPTSVVFDLDPGPGKDMLTCVEVAFLLKDVLDRLSLQAFAKVSGSKGLQVYVPLNSAVTYDVTQPFARTVAELLARERPRLVTAEMAKSERTDRVFIDWSQNAQHKTTVAVYSLRAKRERPFVSMPVAWEELQTAIKARDPARLSFEPKAALARLARLGDLYQPVLTLRQTLPTHFTSQIAGAGPASTPALAPPARSRAKRDVSRPRPSAPRPGVELDRLPEADLGFVAPMKPRLVSQLPEGDDWLYEVKFDGYRALAVKTAGGLRLLSRNNRLLNDRFPTIAQALEATDRGTIIDGEIVALDERGRPSFNRLQNAQTRSTSIVYYAFDILAYRGQSLRTVPLGDRRSTLAQALEGIPEPIRLSQTFAAPAADLMVAAKSERLEGLVAKRLGSVYEPGQCTGAWVKVKLHAGQEVVVGGYLPSGHGFDALLVGYYEGHRLLFIAKVRNGFVPKTRQQVFRRLKELETTVCPFTNLPEPKGARRGLALTAEAMKLCRWVKPRLVVEVAFADWTAGNHLRHARFVGIRDDVDPREVVRERAA